MLLGLRTVNYFAKDLGAAKDWYTEVLGFGPYFDEPFYVGFEARGYELGIQPTEGEVSRSGVAVYWGVEEADEAYERLISLRATGHEPPTDVGEGIKVATVVNPFLNLFGIIENPHFRLKE